jgi:hypothetical protein
MTSKTKSWVGAGISLAVSLGVIYLIAYVVGSGLSAGKN